MVWLDLLSHTIVRPNRDSSSSMWIQKRRGEFRNRRRSIASLMVASIFYLTFLIHVNQIYIKYFKERGTYHKTDKILKKKTLEKIWKKNRHYKLRNITAGVWTCNHLHDARKIAPWTFEHARSRHGLLSTQDRAMDFWAIWIYCLKNGKGTGQ